MDEVIAAGKHLRLKKRDGWEFVERIGATGVVAVVAITDDRRIVLTEQFRSPVQGNVIDLPAGLSGDTPGAEDEALRRAAERELEEEAGYRAGVWADLGAGPPSPGMSSEIVTFFRAEKLVKVSAGGGVGEHERITVHEIPIANLPTWLSAAKARGALIDLKIFAGMYLGTV